MQILGLLAMFFDAAVVFVTKFSLLFRLAVAISWFDTKKCYTFHVSFLHTKQIGAVFSSVTSYVGYANLCAIYIWSIWSVIVFAIVATKYVQVVYLGIFSPCRVSFPISFLFCHALVIHSCACIDWAFKNVQWDIKWAPHLKRLRVRPHKMSKHT